MLNYYYIIIKTYYTMFFGNKALSDIDWYRIVAKFLCIKLEEKYLLKKYIDIKHYILLFMIMLELTEKFQKLYKILKNLWKKSLLKDIVMFLTIIVGKCISELILLQKYNFEIIAKKIISYHKRKIFIQFKTIGIYLWKYLQWNFELLLYTLL